MNKWVFIIGFVLVVFSIIVFNYFLLDGLSGWIISYIDTSDTVYAQNYSDAKYRFVNKGSKAEEVFSLLGPPLKAWVYLNGEWNKCRYEVAFNTNTIVSCEWSYSPSGGSYHRRSIEFKKGIVVAKQSEYYID